MRNTIFATLTALVALTGPGHAQDMTVWRDPAQGCTYIVTPQGGATLRYRRDGTPDCAPPSPAQSQVPAPYINPALQAGPVSAVSPVATSALVRAQGRMY
ncbi:MAG TPA: hypothetical protein VHL98_21415 [Microvirga sp.]|jgi:hypothetical protein|nr:hypothetical protein [Microvirga sp.]